MHGCGHCNKVVDLDTVSPAATNGARHRRNSQLAHAEIRCNCPVSTRLRPIPTRITKRQVWGHFQTLVSQLSGFLTRTLASKEKTKNDSE
jgi:hypothetical protein